MSAERSWWTGLPCRWCGKPVTVTKSDASFHFNLGGQPWAEHHVCADRERAK